MAIKNVLICGLGAVGVTYANKLNACSDLYIVADEDRISRYKTNPPILNGKPLKLNYVLPSEKLDIDLIIISVKSNGLENAINYIENFVGENTIIISLLNGISSEEKIAQKYGRNHVLHSYFIGHSAMREGNSVIQDGVGKIVFGSPYKENTDKIKELKEFFQKGNINYEIPDDIMYSLWLKFAMNIFSNQPSAIMNLTFGQLKTQKFKEFAKKIIAEVQQIAEAEGIKGLNNFEKDCLKSLDLMVDIGKTSMLQDILAGRKTEVDIFAGEIIKLGKKHNLKTPYNQVMYDLIKLREEI